jgi:hypothetical protein
MMFVARFLVFLICAAAVFGQQPRQFFNGKDMTGWQFLARNAGESGFQVSEGLLQTGGAKGTLEITLDGLRTIVYLNGTLVTDYDGVAPVPERTKSYEPERGPRPESGYIGLQNHDQNAVISFKEISVAPLKKKS